MLFLEQNCSFWFKSNTSNRYISFYQAILSNDFWGWQIKKPSELQLTNLTFERELKYKVSNIYNQAGFNNFRIFNGK